MSDIQKLLISPIGGIDHVAYAVRDTKKTADLLSQLGFRSVMYRHQVPELGIYATKMISEKSDVIELIEPIENQSNPVSNMLIKNEALMYHLCFKVDNFDTTRNSLLAKNAVSVTGPFESYLFENFMVSHMYHPSLGLFEIFGEKHDG